MTQPNILWICTDQQRWDTIAALGASAAVTPNIDKLVAEGTAFERAYCQSPICTPSRTSFLTGMYPIAHQVQRNGNDHFPDHLELIPNRFRDAGYRTGLIGKLHLSAAQERIEARPARDGYDEFYWSQHPSGEWAEGHDYADWLAERGMDIAAFGASSEDVSHPVTAEHSQVAWATERALDFMHRDGDARPWMLSINVFDPHPPFDPPKSWFDKFDPAEMPEPVFRPSDLEHHLPFAGVDQQTRKPSDPMLRPAPGEVSNGSHDSPPERYDIMKMRAAYFAMIGMVDEMVGKLVGALDESGARRDTLVIFMSDHGEMLGDHGLLYKGCRFYDGLVRVPLILSQPGRVKQGLVSPALVELVDLPATLSEAAGLAPMVQDQGKSLWPLVTGAVPSDHHKDAVLCEYFDALGFKGAVGSRGSMYFDGRYKITVYHDIGEGELFDCDADPDEFENLWHDPKARAIREELLLKHFNAMMLASGAGPIRISDY